jgi:hypothetical protein
MSDPAYSRSVRGNDRRLLEEILRLAGGALTAQEALERLAATAETLQHWRDAGMVLELKASNGSPLFPIAQFEEVRSDGRGSRPFNAIKELLALARDVMTVDELFGILASPQPALVHAGVERTGFQALADHDDALVLRMVGRVVTPDDVDAPPLAPGEPIRRGVAGGSESGDKQG